MVGPSTAAHGTIDVPDHESDSDSLSDSGDEHSLEEHDMDFPTLNSPSTPTSAPWCDCNGRSYADSADSLGDDGYSVSNAKRKVWEKWVVRRCPEHGER